MKQALKNAKLRYCLPLLIFLVYTLTLKGQHDQTQLKDKIKPGKRQAILILSNGEKVELSATDSLNYTQSVSPIHKVDSSQYWAPVHNKGKKPIIHQQSTAN
ncbi:hypothetical protein KDU71_20545 [Carboxylicivirga sediminis]|uniref:Uncharacterized protein n=1 Tax=Carboxylicivirga sediminis TaxID=2006564 RepID=A0A941FAR6_9BACT|nr:hypothetical protein [Carboxylicivirga sediminis]MBR8537970.1 hypothetical protein [Carboxylicivirga sediminis]